MQPNDWDRLAAPFPNQEISWRVEELSADSERALVRPQLPPEAIVARLDDVLGRAGWSVRYLALGDAVCCELVVAGVAKSAVVGPGPAAEGPERCSRAALARAAELFGLTPATAKDGYWTDYDPDEGVALAPEEGAAGEGDRAQEAPGEAPATAPAAKPAGQQAIDRLVERLRQEGRGLEVARLVSEYGGYGSDPQAARELYGRLRELLAKPMESQT